MFSKESELHGLKNQGLFGKGLSPLFHGSWLVYIISTFVMISISSFSDICDLAEKYKALVFIDECHATGFFGKTGR